MIIINIPGCDRTTCTSNQKKKKYLCQPILPVGLDSVDDDGPLWAVETFGLWVDPWRELSDEPDEEASVLPLSKSIKC